jgi:type II secretory pathway component GspD/PulD (secretin)
MCRAMAIRLSGGLVLLACVGLYAAQGQQPGGQDSAPGTGARKLKRAVYEVQHATAKDLADLLAKLYKSEAGVQTLAAPAGNAVVITAPAGTLDEVLGLLKRLDRRPRSVAVEVVLVEVPPRQGEKGKPAPPAKELDERDLTGNAEDTLAKLQNLQAKGLIGKLKRFRLTAAENRPGSVKERGSKPYVTSVIQAGNGLTTRSVTYRDVGTTVDVTPQIGDDQKIVLELHFTDSRMHVPEDGVVLGNDENGKPIRATHFINAKFDGKVTVRSGEAAVAQGVTTQSKSGQHQTLLLVIARVVGPEAKAGKQ